MLRIWVAFFHECQQQSCGQGVGLLYSMECGSPETLGFTMEALGFALALWHVLPIKLELRDWGT